MHYEDLIITDIKKTGEYWYAKFDSKRGGSYTFPVADADLFEEELSLNGIVIGKNVLGAIEKDKLVALDGLSFIEAKSKSKNR